MEDIRIEQMALAALKWGGKALSVRNVESLVIWALTSLSPTLYNPWSADVNEPPKTIVEGISALWGNLDNREYLPIVACLNESEVPAVTCEAILSSKWLAMPTSVAQGKILTDWAHYATLTLDQVLVEAR